MKISFFDALVYNVSELIKGKFVCPVVTFVKKILNKNRVSWVRTSLLTILTFRCCSRIHEAITGHGRDTGAR